ncbi:hypothetical protein ABZP36_019090 [Zizania latifolia]
MEAEDEYSAGCSFSLMCQEDGTDLDDGFAGNGGSELLLLYNGAGEDGDEEEEQYMEHLVSKESSFCFCSSSTSCFSDAGADSAPSMASEDWFHRARHATVKWILETRGCFGFCHRTTYLAIAYFDRFCLRRCVDRSVMPWAARLLAVACVSLAAKMEEYRAPALSEFRADDDYEFSCVSVRRMELLVLSTLGWRMSAVTPFDYIPCFSSRLRRDSGGGGGAGAAALVAVKAAALIFSAAEEASVLDNRPSTVAAAAVIAASHGALTREALESKMSNLSPSCHLEKEDVHACYTMMMSQSTMPASKASSKRSSPSPSLSSSCSDSTDAASTYDSVDAAASFTAAAATASSNSKRMRLELPGGIHR